MGDVGMRRDFSFQCTASRSSVAHINESCPRVWWSLASCGCSVATQIGKGYIYSTHSSVKCVTHQHAEFVSHIIGRDSIATRRPQNISTRPQKSPRYPQKSTHSACLGFREDPQKSLKSSLKSRALSSKRTCSCCLSHLRKRAIHFRNRAIHFCKRALYLRK